MPMKTSATDPEATQRIRLTDVLEPSSLPEADADYKAARPLAEASSGPDRASAPDQAVGYAWTAPSFDPKATQRIRLPRTQRSSDALRTQPVALSASQGAGAVADRPALAARLARFRQWASQNQWTLIRACVLAAIAIVAIVLAAAQGARERQQAVVGSVGPQMRAASLAQADLSGQDLKWADLSQADLRQANLSGAELIGADLRGADLGEANLEATILRGADLSAARLQRAILVDADLHWAVMRNADLSGADLRGADLQGANLENATFEGANLEGARLNNAHTPGMLLPDGTRWSPRVNLRRFTDPNHPDFWRPEDVQSLAFR